MIRLWAVAANAEAPGGGLAGRAVAKKLLTAALRMRIEPFLHRCCLSVCLSVCQVFKEVSAVGLCDQLLVDTHVTPSTTLEGSKGATHTHTHTHTHTERERERQMHAHPPRHTRICQALSLIANRSFLCTPYAIPRLSTSAQLTHTHTHTQGRRSSPLPCRRWQSQSAARA